MRDERIVENAADIGTRVLGPGLRQLAERHPSIGDVRGAGVFWALELVRDKRTREPLAPYGGTSAAMTETVAAAKAAGLLLFVNFNRLHVVPPCIINEAEAKEGLDILDHVLAIADEHTL